MTYSDNVTTKGGAEYDWINTKVSLKASTGTSCSIYSDLVEGVLKGFTTPLCKARRCKGGLVSPVGTYDRCSVAEARCGCRPQVNTSPCLARLSQRRMPHQPPSSFNVLEVWVCKSSTFLSFRRQYWDLHCRLLTMSNHGCEVTWPFLVPSSTPV